MTNIGLITIGIGVISIIISLLFVAFGSWNEDSTMITTTGIIGLFCVVVGGIMRDREK